MSNVGVNGYETTPMANLMHEEVGNNFTSEKVISCVLHLLTQSCHQMTN